MKYICAVTLLDIYSLKAGGKMTQSIKLTLTLLLTASFSFAAGPFGFEYGMTKENVISIVGKDAIRNANGNTMLLATAPQPHPSFESYGLTISPEKGLLKIVAIGKSIDTSVFGSELHRAFVELNESLSKIYGQPKTFDFLRAGSIWNDAQDWMMSLLKKERTLTSFWNLEAGKPNHITGIMIEGNALSREKGYLVLSYDFEGFSEYLDSVKAKESSVF